MKLLTQKITLEYVFIRIFVYWNCPISNIIRLFE